MNESSTHKHDIDMMIEQAGRGRQLQLSGTLDIAVDEVDFSIETGDGFIVLKCRSLSDVLSLMKKVFLPLLVNTDRKSLIETLLRRTDSTLCLQNRFLSIYGPRANPLLRVMLNGIIATRR